MNRSQDPIWPGIEGAMMFAQESLLQEPCGFLLSGKITATRKRSLAKRSEFIERTNIRSEHELVHRFVLPLAYCPPINTLLRQHFSEKGKLHTKIFDLLMGQINFQRPDDPCEGRPLVRFVRFSVQSRQDRDASWTKVPLDVLQPTREIAATRKRAAKTVHGLGFIRDDANEAIDLRAWWEPGDIGHQFVYCDIWTGEGP